MRAILAVAIWLASALPALAQPFVYVANRQSSFVSVVDAFSLRTIATIEMGGTPVALTMSADGTAAWVTVDTTQAGGPRVIRVIDTGTRTLFPAVTGVPSSTGLSQVVLRPDGARAYVADQNANLVYAIDPASLKAVASIQVASGPIGLVPLSSAAGLVVSASGRTLSLVDLGLNRVVTSNPTGPSPGALLLNPSGAKAYLLFTQPTGFSDVASVVDAPNARIIDTVTLAQNPFGNGLTSAAFSADGSRLYAVNRLTNLLTIVDALQNRVLGTVQTGREPVAVAVNAANTRIYVANAETIQTKGSVSVIDTATQRVIQTIPAGSQPANLALSPNGTQLFVANGGDATLTLIDVATNTVLASLIAGTLPADITFTNVAGPLPVLPQSGWWWNPAESGRGFAIEFAGTSLFMSTNLYAADGTSLWYAASGRMNSLSSFRGSLVQFQGGQTLSGPFVRPTILGSVGTAQLTFSSAITGTLTWPGGTVPIQRFNIVQDGVSNGPNPGLPESGWWWNPVEPGRGYFIEFQRGSLMMATTMYDTRGQAVWYLTQGALTSNTLFQGTLTEFFGGQTLTGSYHAPTQTFNRGAISLQFSGTTTATLTLPGGRTVALSRFRF